MQGSLDANSPTEPPLEVSQRDLTEELDLWQRSVDHHRRSSEASAVEDFKSALRHAKAALQLFPDEPLYLVRAARCLQDSGFQDKALDAVRLARSKLQDLSKPSDEQTKTVARAWRFFFPFDGFPQELLMVIFDELYSQTPLQNPLLVLQICSGWRKLALHQVSLWRDTSIFPDRPLDWLEPSRCPESCLLINTKRMDSIRFCHERSGHSIRNLVLVRESWCKKEISEILEMAWASRTSLTSLEFDLRYHCRCLSRSDCDEGASLKQVELVAEAPLLERVFITLFWTPSTLGENLGRWNEILASLHARKKPVRYLTLAIHKSEGQMKFVELLEPLLVGVKSLAVKPFGGRDNVDICTAAAWKAASICACSLEEARLPLVLPKWSSPFHLENVIAAGTTFPVLHSLVLERPYYRRRQPFHYGFPSPPLQLPALTAIKTEVMALPALDLPSVKTAELELLFPDDIWTISRSLKMWGHLESLTLYLEDNLEGDDLIFKTLRMLVDLFSPVGETSTACPNLSRLHLVCQASADPAPRDYYTSMLPSASRERWEERLPRLDSSIFQLEYQRRRASQGLDPSSAPPSTSTPSAAPASAFTRAKRVKTAEQDKAIWAPCASIDEITLEGWYVDPKLWTAFLDVYPGRATCIPDPVHMQQQLYTRPVKSSNGEKRIHAW